MPYGNRKPYYKICPICKIKFKCAFWQLKSKKSCSPKCGNKLKKQYKASKKTKLKIKKALIGKSLRGDKHPQWKGDSASYETIHEWLLNNFGKASKCENKDCLKKSKYFDWCLKKDKKHSHNRNNYFMLCRKCHCKYDNKDSNYFRHLQKLSKK